MTQFSFVTTFQTLTTCWESYHFRGSRTRDLIPRLSCWKRLCEGRPYWVSERWEKRRTGSEDSRQPPQMSHLHPNQRTGSNSRLLPRAMTSYLHFLQLLVLRKLSYIIDNIDLEARKLRGYHWRVALVLRAQHCDVDQGHLLPGWGVRGRNQKTGVATGCESLISSASDLQKF